MRLLEGRVDVDREIGTTSGVATTPAACKLAEQYGLDLPIIKAVAAILRGELEPRDAVLRLMTLPQTDERTW